MRKGFINSGIGEENRSQLQAVRFKSDQNSVASIKSSEVDSYDELLSYKKLRTRRKKIAAMRMVTWVFLILVVPFIVFFACLIINPTGGANFFGYQMYIVRTDSMVPDINVNDLIIVKKVTSASQVKKGTDITFVRRSDGQIVTHRVFSVIVGSDGITRYVTKGVNNVYPDSTPVELDDIIGIRKATVGWLGQTIMFFRQPYGIVTFVSILAIIVFAIYYGFRASDDIRAVGK